VISAFEPFNDGLTSAFRKKWGWRKFLWCFSRTILDIERRNPRHWRGGITSAWKSQPLQLWSQKCPVLQGAVTTVPWSST